MSYSYQAPLSYENQVPLRYNNIQSANGKSVKERNHSSASAAIAGGTVGLIGGSVIAANRHPYIKNGVPTDTFARKAYDKYAKKAPVPEKESYGQFKEVLNKLDKVKTTDELKTLINNNPKASAEISTALNTTTDEFLSGITKNNLSSNKETIRKKLEAGNKTRFQNMKNRISTCWNSTKKKFEKPAGMDDTMFKSIKKAARQVKSKFIGICALSSAAVLSVAGYIAHKVHVNKKYSSEK